MIKPGPAIMLGLLVVAGGVLLVTQSKAASPSPSPNPNPNPDPGPAKKTCDQLTSEANGLEQHVIELLSQNDPSQEALCQAYNDWTVARSLAGDNGCTLPDSEVPDMPECEG